MNQTLKPRVDFKQLVKDAQDAGFNPLTVLRAGAAGNYRYAPEVKQTSTVNTPTLGTASFANDAGPAVNNRFTGPGFMTGLFDTIERPKRERIAGPSHYVPPDFNPSPTTVGPRVINSRSPFTGHYRPPSFNLGNSSSSRYDGAIVMPRRRGGVRIGGSIGNSFGRLRSRGGSYGSFGSVSDQVVYSDSSSGGSVDTGGGNSPLTATTFAGKHITPHRGWSDAQKVEDRFGDVIGAGYGALVLAADVYNSIDRRKFARGFFGGKYVENYLRRNYPQLTGVTVGDLASRFAPSMRGDYRTGRGRPRSPLSARRGPFSTFGTGR